MRLKSLYAIVFPLFLSGQDLPKPKIDFKGEAPPGYFFLSPVKIGAKGAGSTRCDLIVDHKGNFVYYREYPLETLSGGIKPQTRSHYSVFRGKRFEILNAGLTLIDSVISPKGFELDPHELICLPNGNYIMIVNEMVTMDLSRYKYFNKGTAYGSPAARVICNVIVELNKKGEVVFEWHGKDHYLFEDVDANYLGGPEHVDWMHINSVDVDQAGNLLVSVKNFNELSKIDKRSGKIIWRLGGKKNQFRLINDSLGFAGQHDARFLKNGHLSVFDNGRPGTKRHAEAGKEYRLDEKAMTAELVWQWPNPDAVASLGFGSLIRSDAGWSLVNFGRNDRSKRLFDFISAENKIQFSASSSDSLRNYRVYYQPASALSLARPKVTVLEVHELTFLQTHANGDFIWSTGETGKVIEIKQSGTYWVAQRISPGVFVYSPVINAEVRKKSGN